MQNMSELFEKVKDGGKVELEDGSVAIRKCNILVWNNTENAVDVPLILNGKWKLVKEEEKEMETERWMRADDDEDSCLYRHARKEEYFHPSEVMDRKAFLRWVGKMPDAEKEGGSDFFWPGDRWSVWFHEDNNFWCSVYRPEKGYTRQIFAEYAEMRVEK